MWLPGYIFIDVLHKLLITKCHICCLWNESQDGSQQFYLLKVWFTHILLTTKCYHYCFHIGKSNPNGFQLLHNYLQIHCKYHKHLTMNRFNCVRKKFYQEMISKYFACIFFELIFVDCGLRIPYSHHKLFDLRSDELFFFSNWNWNPTCFLK